MNNRSSVVVGLLLAGVLIGGGVWLRMQRLDDRKEQFIAELAESAVFERHEEFLRRAIEEQHEVFVEQALKRNVRENKRRRRDRTEAYRTEMYRHLVRTLQEAGHEADAIALDRDRSRGP